jgi:thioredoxin-related protein
MHTTLDYIANQVYLTESYADYLNKLKKNKTGKLNSHTIFASPPHLLMRSKNRPAQKVLAVFFEEPNCTQCDFFHTQLMPLVKLTSLVFL